MHVPSSPPLVPCSPSIVYPTRSRGSDRNAKEDRTGYLANALPQDDLEEREKGKAWARLLLSLADNYSTGCTPTTKFRDLLIAEARDVHIGILIPLLEEVAENVHAPQA